MRVTMAAVAPFDDERLRVIKQIGVDHLVYYDMATMPVEYGDLAAVVTQSVNRSGAKPQVLLGFADWSAPRPLLPAAAPAASALGAPNEFTGLYRSSIFGVVYEICARNANQLELRIGAGARFADRMLLTRVAGDIFESTQERPGYYLPISPVVRFLRANGRVASMVVTGNGVRGLGLDRLPTRQ